MNRKTFTIALAALTCAAVVAPVHAQDTQALRIVSGFPPGGAVDSLARSFTLYPNAHD